MALDVNIIANPVMILFAKSYSKPRFCLHLLLDIESITMCYLVIFNFDQHIFCALWFPKFALHILFLLCWFSTHLTQMPFTKFVNYHLLEFFYDWWVPHHQQTKYIMWVHIGYLLLRVDLSVSYPRHSWRFHVSTFFSNYLFAIARSKAIQSWR